MFPFDQVLDAWRRGFDRGLNPGAPVTGHPEPARDPLAIEIDEEGWLHGDSVELWPSVRHSARHRPQEWPTGIIWHATAVKPGTPLWKRIVKYKLGVDRPASWHLIIEADGRIYQSVSFERAAWHCSAGLVDGHRPNRVTVGIELAALDYRQTWPAPQVAAARRVLAALADRYEMQRKHVAYAHSALDPARRADPGPEWMAEVIPELVAHVFEAVPDRVA